MGFGNILSGIGRQVNPFDNGATYNRPQPQPARTPAPMQQRPAMPNQLAVARTPAPASLAVRQPVTPRINLAPQTPTFNTPLNVRTATPQLLTANKAVIAPSSQSRTNVVGSQIKSSNIEKVRGFGQGIGRSAVGTVQGVSGLYDLVTPGTGTNRLSKALQNSAEILDIVNKQNGTTGQYKVGQAVGDLATFAGGGGQGAVAKGATNVPKITRVGALANELSKQGFKGRVLGNAVKNIANPKLQAANAAFTALQTGKYASQGEKTTPLGVGTNLAVGGLALPLAGAVGKEVAMSGGRATIQGAKALKDIAANKPYRQITDDQLAAVRRVSQERAGFGDSIANVKPGDHETYNIVQKQLGATSANNHEVIDKLIGSRMTYQSRLADKAAKLQSAKASVKEMFNTPLNEGGYAKNPFGNKAAVTENGNVTKGLNKDQAEFINEYANDLENMGQGNGVNITKGSMTDGYGMDDYANKRVSNNYRDPSLGSGNMTKADWFEHARQQLESGKAYPGATEAYKSISTAKQSKPQAAPPVPEVLQKKIGSLADNSTPVPTDLGVSKFGWNTKDTPKGIEIYNRNDKLVATLSTKNGRHTIVDSGGYKIVTGGGNAAELAQKMATNHFYAKELDATKIVPKPTETVVPKPQLPGGGTLRPDMPAKVWTPEELAAAKVNKQTEATNRDARFQAQHERVQEMKRQMAEIDKPKPAELPKPVVKPQLPTPPKPTTPKVTKPVVPTQNTASDTAASSKVPKSLDDLFNGDDSGLFTEPKPPANAFQDILPSKSRPNSIKEVVNSGGNPLYHDTTAKGILGILDTGEIQTNKAPFSEIARQGKRVSTTRNFDNYSRYHNAPYRLVIDESKTGQRSVPDNREEFESIFKNNVTTKAVHSLAIDTTNPALIDDISNGKLASVIAKAKEKGVKIELFEGKILPNEQANAEIQRLTKEQFNKFINNTAASAAPKPAQRLPGEAAPATAGKQLPGVSLPQNTAKQAESNFPLRVMMDERADPIRPVLNKLATHDVKQNAPVLEQTAANILKNEDAALALAKRGTSTEANATGMQLLNKYLQDGNMERASDLLQSIAPRFTRQGQETQILAAFSKIQPAGAVKFATQQIEKATPKAARLEDETVIAHNAVKTTAKEIATQLEAEIKQGKVGKLSLPKEPKSPAEMLANRIKATETKAPTEPDPIKDMVNTLHKVAKEVLPTKGKTVPRDPMQLIGQAIKDKAGYKDVYAQAQKIVAEKYADNPAALAELDKYFNSQIARPFSKGQLNTGVQQGLKGTDLSKIVKEHYTKVDETGAQLKQKLIERAGLNDSEATQLSGDIQKRYDELVQTKKDSIIKQMFGDKPTPKQVTEADRIITYTNLGALGRDELRPLVAQKLKIPTLTPQAATEITKRANALQLMAEGSPERNRATAEMMQYIYRQVPETMLNKAGSAWTAGLISGVKTMTGAPVSNATNATLGLGSNPIAAGLDAARTLVTGGPRSNTLVSPINFVRGFKEGLGHSKRLIKTGIDEREAIGGTGQRETNYKNKYVGGAVNGIYRTMGALDRPFYYGQKAQSKAELNKLDRMNNGKNIRNEGNSEIAEKEARQSVLDFDTMLSTGANALKRGLENQDGVAAKAIGKVITTVNSPFVRVPSAGLARMVDYSPMGAPIKAVRQAAEMKWGNQKSFDWRDMNRAIGESATGTGLVVLGYQLAQSDSVSGAYPKDPKEAKRWERNQIQANSVKIGGTWHSLNYFGPVGSLLSQGKRFADSQKAGDSKLASAGKAEFGVGQDALNQSYLQGLNSSMQAVSDPQRSLGNYAKGLSGTVVPAIVNDAAVASDSKQRQVNDGKDAIANRLPGARTKLNVKQDVYGNEIGRKTNAVTGIFNPTRPSDARSDNLSNEVDRLHRVDKNKSELQVTPTAQGKTVSVNGKDVNLTTQQRYDLQKTVGQATQKAWSELIKTGEYKQASDDDKAAMLTNAKKIATELPQREFVIKNNLGTYDEAAGKASVAYSGNSNIASLSKVSTGGSNSVTVNKTIDAHSQKVLNEYNTLDAAKIKSKTANENDYQYKVDQAQYDNKLANGDYTKSQQITAGDSLAKSKVGASYTKDTRDNYGLNSDQLYRLASSDSNGNQIIKDVLAYGDALATATGTKNKFRDKRGNVTINSRAAKSAASGSKSASTKFAAAQTRALNASKLKLPKAPKFASYKFRTPKLASSKGSGKVKLTTYKTAKAITVKKPKLLRGVA